MKDNPAVNNAHIRTENGQQPVAGWFIREGKVGNSQEVMSRETEARIDNWIKKNTEWSSNQQILSTSEIKFTATFSACNFN